MRLNVVAFAEHSPVLFLSHRAGVGISCAARRTMAAAHGPTPALVTGGSAVWPAARACAGSGATISDALRSAAIANLRTGSLRSRRQETFVKAVAFPINRLIALRNAISLPWALREALGRARDPRRPGESAKTGLQSLVHLELSPVNRQWASDTSPLSKAAEDAIAVKIICGSR
jgi:hypothetical protein